MVACVSGIEYNVGETLNTIKYASRARNIKNVAKINAVEAGWDDVEHLQNLVAKLRKQISAIDADAGDGSKILPPVSKQNSISVIRLAELQREHTEVRPSCPDI